MKRRLIWHFLRSGVNALVRQGEHVLLPRLADVAQDARNSARLAGPGDEIVAFGADVADAFHQ
eukprot:6124141-Lingulodinium_polyedra.AAC.1